MVRARIKIRLVSGCLARWREKTAVMRSLHDEAERRAQDSLGGVGARAFQSWRLKMHRTLELEQQAGSLDRQRLLASAFSALATRHAEIESMEQRSNALRHDIELAVLAASLKKMQWAQFTAARRAESAEAL